MVGDANGLGHHLKESKLHEVTGLFSSLCCSRRVCSRHQHPICSERSQINATVIFRVGFRCLDHDGQRCFDSF